MASRTFFEILTEAINDFAANGFDNQERLTYWQEELRRAAEQSLMSTAEMERLVRESLAAMYRRMVDGGRVIEHHPGVARFTIEKLRPQLRAELDRRILASADLIRLNRQEAIERTLRRFSGWATSIPAGGSSTVAKAQEHKRVRKALANLPFDERRVAIDQSSKLVSALNTIIANDAGAIAGVWHSKWRRPGYRYREDHKERDLKVYAIRGSWAAEAGFMNKGAGYTDEITQPGYEVYCGCAYEFLYHLRQLPSYMITIKGKQELARAAEAVRRIA